MRKNSQQILKELRLDQELNRYEHADVLRQAIDDMLNFRVNELDAYHTMCNLVKGNKILEGYINDKIIEHSKNIMAVLGVTVEGFNTELLNIEEMKKDYERTRISKSLRMDKESTNGS